MDRRRGRRGEGKCTRFAVKFHFLFLFFFLVFLTSLRFCLWDSFCKVGGISKGEERVDCKAELSLV